MGSYASFKAMFESGAVSLNRGASLDVVDEQECSLLLLLLLLPEPAVLFSRRGFRPLRG